MRLITFQHDNVARVGALTDDGEAVVDLTSAGIAESMLELIEQFGQARDKIAAIVSSGPKLHVDEVEILAPIPTPRRNIFCVGKNYYEHAAEFGASGFDSGSVGGREIPGYPVIFSEAPASVTGAG